MPMTDLAYQAFESQMEAQGSDYLFPRLSPRGKKPYLGSLKKVWGTTLRRAGVPHFSLYELRHTFATRLSAGGVSDLCNPDAPARRRGRLQALQPGQTRHDARSPGKARPHGERARPEFWNSASTMTHFWNTFGTFWQFPGYEETTRC
jgi:hypothetical protein